jgi:hypothetical protein
MRLLIACLLVIAGLFAVVVLLGPWLEKLPPLALGLLMGALFIGLTFGALWLLNPRGADLLRGGHTVADLEAQGLLTSTPYRAQRAFEVEEFEDEGAHYFIELDDGGVLYLNGQYLYDYAPEDATDDEIGPPRPRRFPCTEFTVRRHVSAGWVADILCGGEVLVPEIFAPPFSAADFRADRVPEDGEVVRTRTYDEIKRERTGA